MIHGCDAEETEHEIEMKMMYEKWERHTMEKCTLLAMCVCVRDECDAFAGNIHKRVDDLCALFFFSILIIVIMA